jgi:hypothetical protein
LRRQRKNAWEEMKKKKREKELGCEKKTGIITVLKSVVRIRLVKTENLSLRLRLNCKVYISDSAVVACSSQWCV